jgi:hypothetical protein
VTRADAEEQRERLAHEHPERSTHTWLLRQNGDDWSVVKVPRLPGASAHPLTASVAAESRPAQADDPRPANERNIPPFGAGI